MWSDIWNVSYVELQILKSSELWSSQLWMQFKQLHIEAWKSQDFNGVWTRDLAILVRRSNQLSYEATDIGSWSFVSSNEPVKWYMKETERKKPCIRNQCELVSTIQEKEW